MKFVNVAELKNRLSAYLSLVRNGGRDRHPRSDPAHRKANSLSRGKCQ